MLALLGASAFSPFRLEQLLQKIQGRLPQVLRLKAQYVYLISHADEYESEKWQHFFEVSNISQELPDGQLFLVTPRIGTISPWSSKATDIATVCDLAKEQRLERGILYLLEIKDSHRLYSQDIITFADLIHDPMTESVLLDFEEAKQLFVEHAPALDREINFMAEGRDAFVKANRIFGLALNKEDIDYLEQCFRKLERNPTAAELMMYGQVNSEHCRHKIFNSQWVIDGIEKKYSLFDMIRFTHQQSPAGVYSAYKDNGAVIAEYETQRFYPKTKSKMYSYIREEASIVIKVETHNHPTAISPFAGAATGAGGEIRDEGATGRGAQPKAGLVGFSVSNLHIPDFNQPWEIDSGKPVHVASALEIMLQGPIGAASFNNEFGRPNICGYFRTLEMKVKDARSEESIRGYHKPIMIAGGYGQIRPQHGAKDYVPVGAFLIVLGGPAMKIGLGGGAASSMIAGSGDVELDFASVQRSNPEMERRCQEVINACWAIDNDNNPIVTIHDVGAGGLANALSEVVHDSSLGGHFQLRKIPNVEPGMSQSEIWCNEAQERYVLAIKPENLEIFKQIAERERCPFAVIGEATTEETVVLFDKKFDDQPVDFPLSMLFGNRPKLVRSVQSHFVEQSHFDTSVIDIKEAVKRVLQLPAVASKNFLITIGDRTVGGLVARDQMVGPWQVPVADVGVTTSSFKGYIGEAVAMGERAPIALVHAPASARMAIGEAITNIAAAAIADISHIKLSANWMASCGYPGEDAALYAAVETVGLELCPALGICIPVGKDSLFMQMTWQQEHKTHRVTSPLSLIISAFAPVEDVRKTLTPELTIDSEPTDLILIDLGEGCHYLGGSALAQVYQQVGYQPPDVDDPETLKSFFEVIQKLNREDLLLAYHDRSDGGLLATICEMGFVSHCGVTVELDKLGDDPLASLFTEELGAVIQVWRSEVPKVMEYLRKFNLDKFSHVLGTTNNQDKVIFTYQGKEFFADSRINLQRLWSETSYRMQALRDNPECAKQEFDSILDAKDPGLHMKLTFDPEKNVMLPFIGSGVKPPVAILREQGINGYVEMAAAFEHAGFSCYDVHMTDILEGRIDLDAFVGLVACGGFSFGDVLGAGKGWAQSILLHRVAREQFSTFFNREDTFTLGVCNGCQMLSHLKELIPGAELWPKFMLNTSEQFEARMSLVEIPKSPSIFFQDMEGSLIPVSVAHGEGRVEFAYKSATQAVLENNLVALRYVDNYGKATEKYPTNPNGSAQGMTGFTTTDGRATILMPHPERVYRSAQNAWHPHYIQEDGPWLRFFRNARVWIGD